MFFKKPPTPSASEELGTRLDTARRELLEQSCLAEYHTAMAAMLRARIDRMLTDPHLNDPAKAPNATPHNA